MKTAKGMLDQDHEANLLRNQLCQKFRRIFELRNAVELDTPVAELTSTLKHQYGEDEKLIYDLKDQGGEALSLRYDLTVPLKRYINSQKISSIKRYQIGKVYRRDQPSKTGIRLREFTQIDFDIVGTKQNMYAESEAICTLIACLQAAGVEDYKIIINHRQYLDHILVSCGVTRNLLRTICSSIDKLDKSKPAAVKAEMKTKGLEDDTIERVFGKVSPSSNFADRQIEHPAVAEDLAELEKFLRASRVDLSRHQNCCSHTVELLRLGRLSHLQYLHIYSYLASSKCCFE